MSAAGPEAAPRGHDRAEWGNGPWDLHFYDIENLDVVDRWNDLDESPIDHMVMSEKVTIVATVARRRLREHD